MSFVAFLASHRQEFIRLLLQHVVLVALSTSVAVAIGVPIGILAAKRPRAAAPVVWFANIVQTIPSLAMFGFLLPLPFVGGLGARVAVIVLILYALLPVIRTTAAGLRSIDRSLIDAGTAMGMTPWQLLRQVELPLALPGIVAGIRVAAVIGVGTATIAAAVGAGGLGEYIFRGLSMVDPTVILAGAVPAALLALLVDGALLLAERSFSGRASPRRRAAVVAGAVAGLTAVAVAAGSAALAGRGADAIRVGSKNFTEQVILGELIAQTLEARGLSRRSPAESRRHVHLRSRAARRRHRRLRRVHRARPTRRCSSIRWTPIRLPSSSGCGVCYADAGITVLPPLGFNNTFAILVRGADAPAVGCGRLATRRRAHRRGSAGFGYEFLQRADGYAGLGAEVRPSLCRAADGDGSLAHLSRACRSIRST